jgi:cytochrome c-type biogenesis protein CcmF
MIANFGYGSLVLTFLVSLYGIGASIYGLRRGLPAWVDSARNAMLLTWPLLTLTALSIITLLLIGSYEVNYVASVTSSSMPFYLRITALWGGQAGSLIFWSWLMAAFASAATLRRWERDREFLPWVIVVLLVTLAFFLSLSIFIENPFERLWLDSGGNVAPAMFQPAGSTLFKPQDGNGLNPLLRHPGMIIHPPMLYLGFVSFVIPYAFAIASLVTGRSDDRWIRITRRWTLVAWLFLSLGLLLGGRWAYDVLGWGGYWGWDPVEIAAFMPWLTGTAFLHSVMIQEKRGMLKHWNMVLVILTYDLVIFGTFLTRSGVLSSVHAFAQSAIGPLFFGFIGLTFVISLSLLIRRWEELKSEGVMTSMFSREALFLLNNLLFMGILIVCFWGVIFPLVSEALGMVGQAVPALAGVFTGEKKTVGVPYYESATGPLFAGLLLLMGIAPLAAWRHSTFKTLGRAVWKPLLASLAVVAAIFAAGIRSWAALLSFWLVALVALVTVYEFWRAAYARHHSQNENLLLALWNLAGRNRRRYGGYIIHLGVVLMAMGIIGIEMFQSETQATLAKGEQISMGRYTITYDSLSNFDYKDGRNVTRAVMTVSKDGQYLNQLYPRRDYYYESQQPMTIPGVLSSMEDDLYVLLVDWQPISSQAATFRVYHNPLVNWLWLGGLVFILGTLVAAWPDKEVEMVAARQRARKMTAAGVQDARA